MPGCDDDVVIVLLPPSQNFQPTIISIPMPCGNCGDETAIMWGTNEYPGSRWGWYQWMGEDAACLNYDFPGE